jgi:hypothetical protein
LIEFTPKIIVLARTRKFFRQLLQRRDERFRDIPATELSPMTMVVGLTSRDL